jgi:FG-GAP repeat.
VLLGNGDGTFRTHADYASAWGATEVQLADLNGDGNLDVVASHVEPEHPVGTPGNAISVLLGNGDGTLQSDVEYAIRPSDAFRVAIDLAIGDLNGDGKPDLVTANFGTHADVSVLLGNGDGTFQSHVEYPVEGDTALLTGVAVADLNGDGKLDLLVTSNITDSSTEHGNLSVLSGRGDGTFPTSTQLSVGNDIPLDATIGDLNGDGKLDVVSTAIDSTRAVVVTRMNQ